MMRRTIPVLLSAALVLASSGCGWSKKAQYGTAGAAGGAVVGGVIGKAAGNTVLGAILGAAVGGAAGVYIGNYMDKQAAEIKRDIAGAKVQRVGEGIRITFDSGILFDVNKAELKQVIEDAKLQAEYAEIGSRPSDTRDTINDMQSGKF